MKMPLARHLAEQKYNTYTSLELEYNGHKNWCLRGSDRDPLSRGPRLLKCGPW